MGYDCDVFTVVDSILEFQGKCPPKFCICSYLQILCLFSERNGYRLTRFFMKKFLFGDCKVFVKRKLAFHIKV